MYKEYCTGCGLCASIKDVDIEMEKNGFREISFSDNRDGFLEKVCPSGGVQCEQLEPGKIWGREHGVFLSYSLNSSVRKKASSGGVLTTIALYLLDHKLVDGIIQVKGKDSDPIETEVVCSQTKEEVLACMGSRYSSSMPLDNIKSFLDENRKYAFIGKPCDVTALRNYLRLQPEHNGKILYMLSFFCAGAPSKYANIRLLNKLNCTEDSCRYLRYRGDGWPGYATAINCEGVESRITYREAWRDTLGRDVRKICRFCLDGIGELADISCGDAWYLDENRHPVFEEADGRNVVFCRTEKGRKLFSDVVQCGNLYSEEYPEFEEELPCYQAYQYDRRASMSSTLTAMRIMGKEIPKYDKKLLRTYANKITFKRKIKRFIGTLQRIRSGKI